MPSAWAITGTTPSKTFCPATEKVAYNQDPELPVSKPIEVTLDELKAGLHLPTGQFHTVVVKSGKPRVHRVRLIGMFFATNKCFLLPSAMNGIRKVVQAYTNLGEGEALVVGHTDTTGEPNYNDPLSLERARAVVAYLKDDVDHWLKQYESSIPSNKRWGATETLAMIRALPDALQGAPDKETIEDFQERHKGEHDLGDPPVDGKLGPKTRRAAIVEYMDLDGTTLPDEVAPTAHGCGENFPVVDTGDGVESETNRRVEVFLFKDGIVPKPAGDNSAPGSSEYPAWVAAITRDIDVSEKGTEVNLQLVEVDDTPRAGVEYVLKFGSELRSGITNDEGVLLEIIPPEVTSARLEVPAAEPGEVDAYQIDIVDGIALPTLVQVANRLEELVIGAGPVAEDFTIDLELALADFQEFNGLPVTGELDEATTSALEALA